MKRKLDPQYSHYLAGSLFCILSCTAYAQPSNQDPYEEFNRHAYKLNQSVDRWVLKPAATVYQTVLPQPARKGINNFFSNVDEVPTVLNDLLQGKVYQATSDSWRFVINTTLGIGGLFDVASKMGLKKHQQDFGLTLAKWGYRSSNYLVLPLLGPSTVRDGISVPINYHMSVYPYINPKRDRYTLRSIALVNTRAKLLRFEKVMKQAALDQYVFERNAYLQRRSFLIKQNQ